MKLGLAFLVTLTLIGSAARADSISNHWSWESFKTAVVTRFHAFFDRFTKPEPPPAQKTDVASNPPSNSGQSNGAVSNPTGAPKNASAAPSIASNGALPITAKAEPSGFLKKLKVWFNGAPSGRAPASAPASAENGSPQASESIQSVDIKMAAAKVNSIAPARVVTPATPFHDTNLVMGHNDVPVFRFKELQTKLQRQEVKKIPLLNLGQEEILDSKAFQVVAISPYPELPFTPAKALETPNLNSSGDFKNILGNDVVKAENVEKIEIPVLEAAKKVTGEKIAKLVYTLQNDIVYTPLSTLAFTEEDLKLLRGLILFEKKDQCHIASGIFSDLVEAVKPEVNESARFHLGVCLHEMNLPTEALRYLTKTMRSQNPSIAHDSIKTATEDIQLQYEMLVTEALLGADQNNYPKESLPQINYLKAKYFIRKNLPGKALESALLVPEKTAPYYKAQYVAAVAEYELGRMDASILRQKNITTELNKNGKDKTVLALFEMNLGRESFQKAKYKDALDAFQKVPKENPLWIQSLIEEGWVQLQSKDMPGAIGNMHSIQSPYFNGVYKPESYVLRSIAYLNICQYPDAMKSIAYLEHFYQPWLEKIDKYNSTHNSAQTYQTVLKQLQGKASQDVDELPYQAIREAARQRDFLNAQESINQLIDENSGYPFVRNLIEKDRKSLLSRRNATILKVAQLRDKIRRASTIPDGMKNYNAWRFELSNLEDFLAVYEFKVKTLKEGLDGLARLTPLAQARIASNKDKVKEQAGKILRNHFLKIATELHQNLENDELLKYEAYAGSGENLRFKIAGGKTMDKANLSNRQPAGQHWDFDGEFWEDEIGNYRSSLKNNCQNIGVASKDTRSGGSVKKGENEP